MKLNLLVLSIVATMSSSAYAALSCPNFFGFSVGYDVLQKEISFVKTLTSIKRNYVSSPESSTETIHPNPVEASALVDLMKKWRLPADEIGYTKLSVEIDNIREKLGSDNFSEIVTLMNQLPSDRMARRQAILDIQKIKQDVHYESRIRYRDNEPLIFVNKPSNLVALNLFILAKNKAMSVENIQSLVIITQQFLIKSNAQSDFPHIAKLLMRYASSEKSPQQVVADLTFIRDEINVVKKYRRRNRQTLDWMSVGSILKPRLEQTLDIYDAAVRNNIPLQSVVDSINQLPLENVGSFDDLIGLLYVVRPELAPAK